MELKAVIEGLNSLKEKCKVNIYSDSKYIVDAAELGWIFKWKNLGWKRNKKTKVIKSRFMERSIRSASKT